MTGSKKHIAVIGGGLCGLTCAIRLTERDDDIEIFEAAPRPGGRTRSFFDTRVRQWVDNGPHLLVGAYHRTRQLLQEAGADQGICWQHSLELPLWDAQRGHFQLAPNRQLPLALAMPWACFRLPEHRANSAAALLRLAMANQKSMAYGRMDDHTSVHDWLRRIGIPQVLIRDLLEPLCFGVMNESIQTANAKSFSRVLREAFDSHDSARLGWFKQPLSEAMVKPLMQLAISRGTRIRTGVRVRRLHVRAEEVYVEAGDTCKPYDAVVIALPARARDHLLGNVTERTETRCITNIHLWFTDMDALPKPFIGGLGTTGQWFFDVSQQMPGQTAWPYRHICAVISADPCDISREQCVSEICRNFQDIMGMKNPAKPDHFRMVREFHATTQVRARVSDARMPERIVDVSEAPLPGELPATIEAAVIRGEKAAKHCQFILDS